MKKLLIILLTLPICSFGQKILNQGEILQKNFCDTIHFDYVKNYIIVPVKINGGDKRFILDTGAPLMISEDIQSSMKGSEIATVSLSDINETVVKSPIVKVEELQLGSIIFKNSAAVVSDVKNSGILTCFNYDGVIGSNLLRNCIVHIDVEKKIIILTNNLANLKLQNPFQSSLTLDKQSRPFIKLNLSNVIEFEGLFDSGSNKFLSVSQKIADKAIKQNTSRIVNEGLGSSTGLHGAGEAIKRLRIKTKSLIFGNAEITDFITIVSDKTNEAVGMQLAEYGTITIDYLNKNFYFVPNEQLQTYKHQKTLGFNLQPEKNKYTIGTVWTGTQAEKIGLKNGFQILKINDIDFSNKSKENDCKWFLSDMFDKAEITLTYKDDKEQIKTVNLTEE